MSKLGNQLMRAVSHKRDGNWWAWNFWTQKLFFVSTCDIEYIFLSVLTNDELFVPQKCIYCNLLMLTSDKVSACVQCSVGRCCTSFHVTCARAAGVLFESSEGQTPVFICCSKHTSSQRMSVVSYNNNVAPKVVSITHSIYMCLYHDIETFFYILD